MPRLTQIDAQCAVSLAAAPPNAYLIEENLRGYVVLLRAHFQGFCRDLYTEAAQLIASRVPQRLRTLILAQFVAHRADDSGAEAVVTPSKREPEMATKEKSSQ